MLLIGLVEDMCEQVDIGTDFVRVVLIGFSVWINEGSNGRQAEGHFLILK